MSGTPILTNACNAWEAKCLDANSIKDCAASDSSSPVGSPWFAIDIELADISKCVCDQGEYWPQRMNAVASLVHEQIARKTVVGALETMVPSTPIAGDACHDVDSDDDGTCMP